MKKSKTVSENNDGLIIHIAEDDSHYSLESYLERHKDKIPSWNTSLTTVDKKSIFINTANLISDIGDIEISIKENDKNLLVSMAFNKLQLSNKLKEQFNNLLQIADTVSADSNGEKIILTFTYYFF